MLRLSSDVIQYILEILCAESPFLLRACYKIQQLRPIVLDTLRGCERISALIPMQNVERFDLHTYLRFGDLSFNREQLRRFSLFSKRVCREIMGKQKRIISFTVFWEYVCRNGGFAAFVAARPGLQKRAAAIWERRNTAISLREANVIGMLKQQGLSYNQLPRDIIYEIRSYVSHYKSMEPRVQALLVRLAADIRAHRVCKRRFSCDPRGIPELLHYCCTAKCFYVLMNYGNAGQDSVLVSYSPEGKLIKLHFRMYDVIDLKTSELGDIIVLGRGKLPWLRSYTVDGYVLWNLYEFTGRIYSPQQLQVGRSGTSYVNDPVTMSVHRVSPEGDEHEMSLYSRGGSPDAFCLDEAENVCILTRNSCVVHVYNWACEQIASIHLGELALVPVKLIIVDNKWIVVDHGSKCSKVYGKEGQFLYNVEVYAQQNNIVVNDIEEIVAILHELVVFF